MTNRLMTKDGLRPYFALHRDIAGRVDLEAADKLTWAALADFLPRQAANPADCWIAPPATWLARKAALSARQVRRSLRRLEDAGLVLSRPRTGRPTAYAVLAPPPLEPDATGLGQAAHAAPEGAADPGQDVRGTPDRKSAPPGQEVRPHKTRTRGAPDPVNRGSTPPSSAFVTGGQEVRPSHVHVKRQRARTHRSPTRQHLEPQNLIEVAALAAADAAARALGLPLHAGWVGAILDDCRVGASAIWTEVTMEDFQAAQELARQRDGFRFGPWAVRAQHVDKAEAADKAKRRQAAQEQRDLAEQADRQAVAEQRQRQRAHFDQLPPDRQAGFLEQAQGQCDKVPPAHRAAAVRSMAGFLAYRQAQTAAPTAGTPKDKALPAGEGSPANGPDGPQQIAGQERSMS